MHSGKKHLLLLFAVATAAFFPFLIPYFRSLWAREYYQFFPIALIATGALAYSRAGNFMPLTRPRAIVLNGSLILALVLAGAATWLTSPWIGYLGFIVFLACGLWSLQDVSKTKTLLYLLLPALLTVRPPLNLDTTAISQLQRITTKMASDVLNIAGLDHIRDGNVIKPFNAPALMVEEACSGVQSLFTVMFLAALICVINRYGLMRTLFLLVCGVAWAGVMNTMRVVCIAIAQTHFGIDLAHGTPHEVLGYVALVTAALLLLSSDRLFYFFMAPIAQTKIENPIVNGFNWFSRPPSQQDFKEGKRTFPLLAATGGICLLLSLASYQLPSFSSPSQNSSEAAQ